MFRRVQNVTYIGHTQGQHASVKKKALPFKMAKATLPNPAHIKGKNQDVRATIFPHQEERLEKLEERIRQLCWDALVALRSNARFNR